MAKTKEKDKVTKESIEVKVIKSFWLGDRVVNVGEIIDIDEDTYRDCLDNNLIERG